MPERQSHDELTLLGKHIRDQRIERGLKIADVAQSTGLTSSMISQVERAVISPSIETLKKISMALDTPLGSFFETVPAETPAGTLSPPSPQSPVVHESQRKVLSPGAGVTYYLLNPDMSGPIEFIYNIYEPGAGTGAGAYTHPGSECGLILEGELLVTISGVAHHLKQGDSITFSSSEPHSKRNVGDKRCVCVWANSPPWF